jgi:hypothetical protein
MEKVDNGLGRLDRIAKDTIADANYALSELSKVGNSSEGDIPDFTIPPTNLAPFAAPSTPGKATLSFRAPNLTFSPSFRTPSALNVAPTPTFDVPSPGFEPIFKPAPFDGEEPGDAPDVGDVFIPPAPLIVLPDVPIARDIIIPDAGEITLPIWDEVAPDDDIPPPSGEFVWAEPGYESMTLDQVTARIQTMLQGGTGLPDAIWNMIWDRTRAALYEQRDAAIEEATERWAARGFSVPGGALNKQIERAIRAFNNASAEQLRETAIKQAEMEVQNMQFAVAQGIALETLQINLYDNIAKRSLEAAKTVFDIANAIFSARIQKYNADAQVFQVKAQVHKTLIEAELAKLEEYKLKLEGQKLIGELNLQEVQIYTAQIEALTKEIDIFRAQLEGVKAQVEVDKTRVEAYSTGVGAYGERIKAKALEYQAFESEVKAELGKAEVYKAQTDAFSSRVTAYAKGVDAEVAKLDADLKYNQSEVERFKAYLGKFEAEVRAESAKIDAQAKQYDAEARIYAAGGEVAKAISGFNVETAKVVIAHAQAQAEIGTRKAQILIENSLKESALTLEKYKTIAQVQAQLGASALAAYNVSASVSGSGSSSVSRSNDCNTSHSYSY